MQTPKIHLDALKLLLRHNGIPNVFSNIFSSSSVIPLSCFYFSILWLCLKIVCYRCSTVFFLMILKVFMNLLSVLCMLFYSERCHMATVLGYRVKSIKFITVECSFSLIIGIKWPVAEFSTLRKQKNDFRVANRQAPHVLSFSVPKSWQTGVFHHLAVNLSRK